MLRFAHGILGGLEQFDVVDTLGSPSLEVSGVTTRSEAMQAARPLDRRVMPLTLWHGDCLDLMAHIPDGSVDMILCDLPYGTTACKWDTVIPFEPLWAQYRRIAKRNAAIVLFGVEPFSSFLRSSWVSGYRYDWYWNKRHGANFAQANKRPLKSIECISVFYTSPPLYNPQKTLNQKGPELRNKYAPSKQKRVFVGQVSTTLEFSEYGSSYESDKLLPKALIEFKRDPMPVHPTQKPVALMEYLIRTYTHEGETVLDNCMGSGTTGIACLNTGRNFIGIEKDQKYFEIARNRIEGHNVLVTGAGTASG